MIIEHDIAMEHRPNWMQDAEGFWSAIFVHHSNPPGSLLYTWMQIPGKKPITIGVMNMGFFSRRQVISGHQKYLGSQPEVLGAI